MNFEENMKKYKKTAEKGKLSSKFMVWAEKSDKIIIGV